MQSQHIRLLKLIDLFYTLLGKSLCWVLPCSSCCCCFFVVVVDGIDCWHLGLFNMTILNILMPTAAAEWLLQLFSVACKASQQVGDWLQATDDWEGGGDCHKAARFSYSWRISTILKVCIYAKWHLRRRRAASASVAIAVVVVGVVFAIFVVVVHRFPSSLAAGSAFIN